MLKEAELKERLQNARAGEKKAIRAKIKANEDKIKNRNKFAEAISDISEVETVKEPKSFFNVDINLDNLKVTLDHIK